MQTAITLVDKVRSFDNCVGLKIERQGPKSINIAEHEHLRKLLTEANYEVVDSEYKTDFPSNKRYMYARPRDDGVEVFVERAIQDWIDGFTYLRFNSMNSYNDFFIDYKKSHITSEGTKVALGAGIITMLGSCAYGFAGNGGGLALGFISLVAVGGICVIESNLQS